MCGIVGMFSNHDVAAELYDSLIQLQHRGQDSAGILTSDSQLHAKRGTGLVRDIFQDEDMEKLTGDIGIGHTRYPTSGTRQGFDEVQPFTTSVPFGMALVHNGNIVNYAQLRDEIIIRRNRYLNTHSDSEMLLQLFADSLQRAMIRSRGHSNPTGKIESDEDFFSLIRLAVADIFSLAKGSISALSVINGKGIVAMRDPYGVRPLVMGERVSAEGKSEYIFASEDTMFYMLGFTLVRDVLPGEVIYVSMDGILHSAIIEEKPFCPCIFEYVYFARPDAMLNNVSVYRARLRMGQNLGQEWIRTFGDVRPDVIIPAPSTANTMALAMARELGVNYSEGLYKNPFIGRTFIMPSQAMRRQSVRYKLSPQRIEIRNKNVLIVDDSIVRGTTSKEIVSMIRDFGANQVWFASACPPVVSPCHYGVDIPTAEELIANRQTQEEVRNFLGVEKLLYLSIEALIEAVTRKGRHNMSSPCHVCLGGPHFISGEKDGIA
ncbi:amidophosphoribosyltransferase [Parasphaerochaeta coccoides]|uniref:Amidophosphoribosyltransferase n=1 Tax=Parasphaerochaeta coccoides (strain ATCC BAA-1237 / DSM 17374 / SPN1) TaxID=760011 RepID=F4GHX3_PARC1|nr:amidophosphoribosyltransferase [Parasphaerochaeta coccoides]AEC02086.1 amidophosphoribosyltransferase [Parasphaerochaeta coccoides DSM 17374]